MHIGSAIPQNAVVAGQDTDGSVIYVGRGCHAGDLIPAKAIPSRNIAYVPYGCYEHDVTNYHVSVKYFNKKYHFKITFISKK